MCTEWGMLAMHITVSIIRMSVRYIQIKKGGSSKVTVLQTSTQIYFYCFPNGGTE